MDTKDTTHDAFLADRMKQELANLKTGMEQINDQYAKLQEGAITFLEFQQYAIGIAMIVNELAWTAQAQDFEHMKRID